MNSQPILAVSSQRADTHYPESRGGRGQPRDSSNITTLLSQWSVFPLTGNQDAHRGQGKEYLAKKPDENFSMTMCSTTEFWKVLVYHVNLLWKVLVWSPNYHHSYMKIYFELQTFVLKTQFWKAAHDSSSQNRQPMTTVCSMCTRNVQRREFPCGPVVRTPLCCWGPRYGPWSGDPTCCTLWPKK